MNICNWDGEASGALGSWIGGMWVTGGERFEHNTIATTSKCAGEKGSWRLRVSRVWSLGRRSLFWEGSLEGLLGVI